MTKVKGRLDMAKKAELIKMNKRQEGGRFKFVVSFDENAPGGAGAAGDNPMFTINTPQSNRSMEEEDDESASQSRSDDQEDEEEAHRHEHEHEHFGDAHGIEQSMDRKRALLQDGILKKFDKQLKKNIEMQEDVCQLRSDLETKAARAKLLESKLKQLKADNAKLKQAKGNGR